MTDKSYRLARQQLRSWDQVTIFVVKKSWNENKTWTVCWRCDNGQKFTKNTRISKLNGKGHKAKGQILKLSNGSLWNEYLGILLFLTMQYLYCAPRTLMYIFEELITKQKLVSLITRFETFNSATTYFLDRVPDK